MGLWNWLLFRVINSDLIYVGYSANLQFRLKIILKQKTKIKLVLIPTILEYFSDLCETVVQNLMNQGQSYYFKGQHHKENSLDRSGENRDVDCKSLLKGLQFSKNSTCGHAWLCHFPYVHPASYREQELNILLI